MVNVDRVRRWLGATMCRAVGLGRFTVPPATSRRRFCLPCTLVGQGRLYYKLFDGRFHCKTRQSRPSYYPSRGVPSHPQQAGEVRGALARRGPVEGTFAAYSSRERQPRRPGGTHGLRRTDQGRTGHRPRLQDLQALTSQSKADASREYCGHRRVGGSPVDGRPRQARRPRHCVRGVSSPLGFD